MEFAVVEAPVVTIYEGPEETKETGEGMVMNIGDEGLHGMLFAILGKEREFYSVRTFYGYTGYVKEGGIRLLGEENARRWEESRLMVINAFCADIVSIPRVQGVRLTSLYRGALVQVCEFESRVPGWARVRLADGRIGYLRNQYLRSKEFFQTGLWTKELPQKKIINENDFRQEVIQTAETFLGVQYRWGGRSTPGIDCSGLTSVSYMLSGILTYRDAKIVEGFPVHSISREKMLPGDLIYFPGHIAMYLGNGRYIHSTGKIGSGGVVVNSLNPQEKDYRRDLTDSILAVGSIF